MCRKYQRDALAAGMYGNCTKGNVMEKQRVSEMDRICVSVIIPTYNRTQYIERAVKSVCCQSHKNLDIIIVDDNIRNSQESLYIESVIGRMDERIRIIKTEGKVGGGKARNIGVREARGTYLAFLDDDDIFLPDKVKVQLAFIMENDYDMAIQDIEWYDQNDKLVEHRSFSYIKDDSPEYMLKQHIIHHLAPTGIYMIKKSAFDKTEGFGETPMGQDWRLMLSCCKTRLKIGYISGVYVHQYLHEGERISIGRNKIDGENSLYEIKKQHMYLLNTKERRYVRFRHYAVLMFGWLRAHEILKAMPYGIMAFFISPRYCWREARVYLGGKRHV